MEDLFIALLFILYGAIGLFRPDLIAKFQTWSNKKLLGATFKASKRTLKYYRFIGGVFIVLAVLLLLGIIE